MISNHYTECVCNHLTHFAVLMEFTDNADEGKVNIFFSSTKQNSYGFKKVHSGIKTMAFISIYFYLLIKTFTLIQIK